MAEFLQVLSEAEFKPQPFGEKRFENIDQPVAALWRIYKQGIDLSKL
jgi:hypothetical protein